jgi:hypothetical protein
MGGKLVISGCDADVSAWRRVARMPTRSYDFVGAGQEERASGPRAAQGSNGFGDSLICAKGIRHESIMHANERRHRFHTTKTRS